MKPAVAGSPARASIEIVSGQASSGRSAPRPCDRADVVAVGRLALAGDDHGEGGEVHEGVGGEVEDERADARPRRRRRRRRACSRPGRRRSSRASASASPGRARRRCRRRSRSPPGPPAPAASRSTSGPRATSKKRRKTAKAAALVATAMKRGDRGRRALVDVGRPLVEGGDRGLEGEADRGHRDPDQDQRVAEHALVRRSRRRSRRSRSSRCRRRGRPSRRAASPSRASRRSGTSAPTRASPRGAGWWRRGCRAGSRGSRSRRRR